MERVGAITISLRHATSRLCRLAVLPAKPLSRSELPAPGPSGPRRWIAVLRQIVLCLRLLEAAAQECHPGCPMCLQSLANRLRFVAAGHRAVDCQAAAGVAGTCLQIGSSFEELLCHLPGRGFLSAAAT